jgi:hypothetical protein
MGQRLGKIPPDSLARARNERDLTVETEVWVVHLDQSGRRIRGRFSEPVYSPNASFAASRLTTPSIARLPVAIERRYTSAPASYAVRATPARPPG